MAVQQLKDGCWVVRYRKGTIPDDPVRTREYFGRGAQAEATARARNEELGFGRRRTRKKPGGPLFSSLAVSYMKDKRFNPDSRKHLALRLSASILPFFGPIVAAQITHEDMRRYVDIRRKATRTVIDRANIKKTKKNGSMQEGRRIQMPIKDATISHEPTDVKAILNWATRQKPPLIAHNPVRDFQKPKPERVDIRPPTMAETRAILKAVPAHLVHFIKLSYLGVRPGAVELLGLTWDAVNWDTSSIEVISDEKGAMVRRTVPIHEGFAAELKTWWEEDGKKGTIIHYRRKPVKRIQATWENTLTRAGIKRRLRPYDLRHNFITAALEEGADIGAVAAIVGSSPDTLRRHYQHVTNRLRRQTVALIRPIEVTNKHQKESSWLGKD